MELNGITNRQWSINACSATIGDGKKAIVYAIGVKEGMQWLIEIISKKNEQP